MINKFLHYYIFFFSIKDNLQSGLHLPICCLHLRIGFRNMNKNHFYAHYKRLTIWNKNPRVKVLGPQNGLST